MTDPIVAALARALHGAGLWPDYPHWADPAHRVAEDLIPALAVEGLAIVSATRLAKLERLDEAARRLAKVLDLASSVHISERRAARIAFHAALAALDEEERR